MRSSRRSRFAGPRLNAGVRPQTMLRERISTAVRYLAIVNFFGALAGAIYLRGDALNGKIEGGKYFLNWHGQFTEVSAGVFTYSRWHLFISMALLAAAAASVLVHKPTPIEQKWQGRIILGLIGITAAYAYKTFGV